ncbi:MAG: hypothetical protein HY242_03650 [Afipia sp.]|nr:hypothetical protein [Afipia sp.]
MKLFSEFARRALPALVIGILIAPLAAQNALLDKPFLDANDFYLRSAGFRVRLADNPVTKKALSALPPHKMVVQKTFAGVWYVFADPKVCMCIFAGTKDNLESYKSIVANPLPGVDNNVPADHRTQASYLLGNMSDIESDSLADVLRDYF